MDPLVYFWAITLLAALWLVPYTMVRTLAYRSGQIDHTPTMKKVAIFSVTLTAIDVFALAVLSILILARGGP